MICFKERTTHRKVRWLTVDTYISEPVGIKNTNSNAQGLFEKCWSTQYINIFQYNPVVTKHLLKRITNFSNTFY